MAPVKLLTIVLAALFLLIVSAVTRASHLYFMSAALSATPLVSYALGRAIVRGLRCSRQSPEYAVEDEEIRVSLRLEGKSNLLGPVEVDDTLPEWVERTGNTVDCSDGVTEGDSSALVLSYSAVALKRGEYTIGPLELHVTDPLGLFRFKCRYPLVSQLVVHPAPLVVPDLNLLLAGELGEQQFEGAGAKGSGIEFHGVREYQPGDELRRIHWRSTAKHGRLNVIEFEHSPAVDVVMAIDLKRGSEVGSGRFTSLEYAVRIAAGIAEQTILKGNSVRLACPGVEGASAIPGKGPDQLFAILNALAGVAADQDESLSGLLLREYETLRSNSAVVCLASGIDGSFIQSVELLAVRGIKVMLILVSLSSEVSPGTEQLVSRLVSAGAGVAIVECSPDGLRGRTGYAHAA